MRSIGYVFFLVLISHAAFAQKSMATHLAGNEEKGDKLFYLFSYNDAVNAYEAALEQYPDENRIKVKLAETYRLLNKPEEAVKYYGMVAESDQAEPIVMLHYAQSLNAIGEYDTAKIWYTKYKKVADSDSRSIRSISSLDKLPELFKDSLTYYVDELNINSEQADFSPTYYRDGIVFVSSREPKKGIRPVFNWNDSHFLDLYYSEEHEDGTNTEPVPFHKNVNTQLHEGPTVFFDGENKMIFTRNNLLNGKKGESTDGVVKLKLYLAERADDDSWGKPTELPFNNNDYSVGHPSISQDGNVLVFVSDMPGGLGGTDIYKSIWKDGNWSDPENLGKDINTEGNEMFPFLQADGMLYFSSNGHGGLGGLDVYSVNLNQKSMIKNLGYPVNTKGDDFGFILSSDGLSGYFSSNRKGGVGDDDIYHFTIRQEIIDVLVYDQKTNENISAATVQLFDNNKIQSFSKTNPNGEVSFQVNPQKNYLLKVSKIGYESAEVLIDKSILQSENIVKVPVPLIIPETTVAKNVERDSGTILNRQVNKLVFDGNSTRTSINALDIADSRKKEDVIESSGNQPAIEYYEVINPTENQWFIVSTGGNLVPINTETFSPDGIMELSIPGEDNRGKMIKKILLNNGFKVTHIQIKNIYYDYDRALIRNDASVQLDKVVNILKGHNELHVQLAAHTDSRGSVDYNRTLAWQRVESAKKYLTSEGVDLSRILTASHGEKQLLNECADGVTCQENKHQTNRRTEIKLLLK